MNPALLYKLRAYGICGKTYNLILSVPSMTDQVEVYEWDIFDPQSTLREKRGLREGCPLSPILFSVFINDILPEPRERLLCWEPKVEGLMFGDDIVVFARTADR